MSFNNFLNKSIYILLAVLLCIAIFIGSFFFNPFSFAEPLSSFLSGSYLSFDDSSNTLVLSNTSNQVCYLYSTDSVTYSSITFNFSYSYSSSTSPTVRLFSNQQPLGTKTFSFKGSNSYSFTFEFTPNDSSNYFGFYSDSYNSNSTIVFDSIIVDDINILSSSSSSSSFDRTITIKPGYVAYVETDGGTLDLTATFPILSNFSRPLWNDHVRIAFGGYYAPSSGTIFNDSFGSSIDWLKPASAPTNILGKTYIGGRSFDAGLPSDGSSVVIYNPAYMGFNNVDPSNHNGQTGPTLTAHFSNAVFVQQFPLRTSSTFDSSAGWVLDAGSPDNYDDSYIYSPSETDSSTIVSDTDYYFYDRSNDTTSSAISLPNGGYNTDVDNSSTVEDGNRTIRGLLNTIIEFLSAPIAHIQNLFNSGSSFMTWLSQLFTWLPEPVSAVITSALIVLIVIGVIKFLWK